MLTTISSLQNALSTGETDALSLTKQALSLAEDHEGQGRHVFTRIYHEKALAAARASDILRKTGTLRSPLEGLPISIKDLFDVAGEPTLAGSIVLRDAPPAKVNAAVVEILTNAGAIIIGKTNMVEFAFSGLGLNCHYGTPHSPWDRESKRIPGGSSSGAGVAVAEHMSVLSIGSDTGGSVRIPAAFCGLTGFKPTARRISTRGALPLSTTLDSIGGIAASVDCCAIADTILSESFKRGSGASVFPSNAFTNVSSVTHLRLVIPKNVVMDGSDDTVRSTFHSAIQQLMEAGADVDTIDIPEFSLLSAINAKGGFTGAEAWSWHKDLLEKYEDKYDPRVASRIIRCQSMTAVDYIELIKARRNWIQAVNERTRGYDALLMPTVPIIAPRIEDIENSDEVYFATNRLVLRNPTLVNFWDGCAVSLPCHSLGAAPVGLMVAGQALQDKHILGVAKAIESILQPSIN